MALTVEQMNLVAEGMFPGYAVVGSRHLKDKNDVHLTIVRVRKNGESKRVLFFGTEAPVVLTTPERDHLAHGIKKKSVEAALLELYAARVAHERKAKRRPCRVAPEDEKWADERLFGTVDVDCSA